MPTGAWFGRGLIARGGADFTTDVNISSGGVDIPVAVASSATTIVSHGAHFFSATTATYLLANPEVGREIYFFGGAATGTTHTVVINTTASLFMSSSGTASARQFAANGGFGLKVFGTSSGLYNVHALFGNVVFSSST